jgi:hypothetical protein
MVTIESIRKMYLREGRSIRDISRPLGVSGTSGHRLAMPTLLLKPKARRCLGSWACY